MGFYKPRTRSVYSSRPSSDSTPPFTASVSRKELSDEQVRVSMQRLHDDMKSYRMRREKDMDDSLEFAKHYTCR